MGDTTEDTPVKKIREIMKERGFNLHAHSPDYKCMDVTHQFDEERDIYKNKMVEALKDWADNWEGWLDKKENMFKSYEF